VYFSVSPFSILLPGDPLPACWAVIEYLALFTPPWCCTGDGVRKVNDKPNASPNATYFIFLLAFTSGLAAHSLFPHEFSGCVEGHH